MKEEISLYDILKQLYSISGILIDVYSLDGESLARYPDRGAELCRLVNEDPRGCVRCGRANQEGFAQVRKEHKVHIYKCHMGLYEAVVPLYYYGTLAGYMMMGQMLEKGEEARAEVIEKAKSLGLGSSETIESAVDGLVQIDLEEIETFVTLCRICADYITNHHQFPVSAGDIAEEVRLYLEEHYGEKITLKRLCSWFGYSKTRLNQLFRESMGMSIYHCLMEIRMEKAKESLKKSEKSIYSIAQECGFSDQNYFARQFKKHTGCTPGEYRRNS